MTDPALTEQLLALMPALQELVQQQRAAGALRPNFPAPTAEEGAAGQDGATTPPAAAAEERPQIERTPRTDTHFRQYKECVDQMAEDCKSASHVWMTEETKAKCIDVLQKWDGIPGAVRLEN